MAPMLLDRLSIIRKASGLLITSGFEVAQPRPQSITDFEVLDPMGRFCAATAGRLSTGFPRACRARSNMSSSAGFGVLCGARQATLRIIRLSARCLGVARESAPLTRGSNGAFNQRLCTGGTRGRMDNPRPVVRRPADDGRVFEKDTLIDHQHTGRAPSGREALEHPNDIVAVESFLDFHSEARMAEVLNDAEDGEPSFAGRWVTDIEVPNPIRAVPALLCWCVHRTPRERVRFRRPRGHAPAQRHSPRDLLPAQPIADR